MSEEPHGATTIRASKGGGAAKWLIGGAAAVLLVGAGYFAWKTMAPAQDTEIAANDPYAAEPLSAGARPPEQRASAENAIVAPASTEAAPPRPARRSRAAAVPEETIGITPVNATTEGVDSDEIVVTAPQRPVWARTPNPRRLSAMYPERALERGREGEARLNCIVQNGGALDCERLSETPGGFGNAALRVASTLRHAPTLADGSDAAGTPVRLRVVFRMEDERRRG